MAIPTDQKEAIKAAGNWDQFLEYRDQLKTDGLSPADAAREALAKFLPESEKRFGDYPELEAAPRSLAGKAAPEVESIRWAANHIDDPCPDPETCPAPIAWTLLRECRRSPAFRENFIQNTWTKLLPTRSQMEKENEAASEEMDGQSLIDTIDKIREISRKAEEDTLRERLEMEKRISLEVG